MNILNDKSLYASYVKKIDSMPIFNKPFWLDAVCGEENWHVVLVTDNEKIVAAMPFFIKVKRKFEIITIPTHTQRFSPCINYPEKIKTYSHKIDFENKVISTLLSALPRKIYFKQSFHFDYKNTLPFFWSGYRVNYNHTYVIDDISSLDQVLKGFSNNRRRSIKKAKKNIKIYSDLTAEGFYNFHKESLRKKNSKISYSEDHFKRIYTACKKNKCGKIFNAIDTENNLHAALFVIWDQKAAYHLIPVVNPEFHKSQSISLLVLHAIEYLKNKTKSYDFEGSMTVNVEKAYREYGAKPKPFFQISTSKFKLIRHLLCI